MVAHGLKHDLKIQQTQMKGPTQVCGIFFSQTLLLLVERFSIKMETLLKTKQTL